MPVTLAAMRDENMVADVLLVRRGDGRKARSAREASHGVVRALVVQRGKYVKNCCHKLQPYHNSSSFKLVV